MKRSSRLHRWLINVFLLYSFTLTLLCFQNHNDAASSSPLSLPQQPRIIYRRDYNNNAAGEDRPTTFLLGIFTVMEDVQRRRLIRETMLATPDNVAIICSLQSYMAMSSGSDNKKCQIIYTFVVGGNRQASTEWKKGTPMTMDASLMLKHETDILYLNIKENMNDGKTFAWFNYASSSDIGPTLSSISFDYIAKADSDTLISIPQLQSYIVGHLPPASQHPKVYGGFLNEYQACGGAGPLCDKIRGKVYMSGQFYWLSHDLAKYVSSSSPSSLRIPRGKKFISTHNEDLDLGIRILSYPEPIALSACNGAQFWVHPLKQEGEWLEEFRRLQDNNWQIADTRSYWLGGGLYEDDEEDSSSSSMVQSILGHIREANVLPIFLD